MATCPAQEKSLADFLSKCQGLGVEKYIQPLNARQVSEIIGSKVFGNGIFFPEAGNVHPGKMVLALKRSAIQAGVRYLRTRKSNGSMRLRVAAKGSRCRTAF
ncbi:FAD-dependent oxidoreductase [Pseudomonas sp. A014]|uniref:FAD-dependent oxidoreductase n=1 Tax=Pseudomonas sp. A014 TaxID=3458058 RepID=UPI0040359598